MIDIDALLPDTGEEGALVVAEHFLEVLRNLKIKHINAEVEPYLSISIGSATVYPHGVDTALCLLENADNMLYRAKKSGRNQICMDSN